MTSLLRQWLLLAVGLIGAQAGEAGVRFVPSGTVQDEPPRVATMELFADQAALLTWKITGLPGTKTLVRGTVLQAASGLAVPLKNLAFEVKTEIAAGSVHTEASHTLALPETGKPAVYVIRWQAVNGEAAVVAEGTIRLRLSLRGILTPLQNVSLTAETSGQPLVEAFERDAVKVSRLESAELPAAWQGVLMTKAGPAAVEKIKALSLEPGQHLIVFADVPDMPDTILAKQAGRGRLIILPASRLAFFATQPALQRLVVEFCQPVS